MFIHLHTRSYYSFMRGLTSPGELAQAAARMGMPALALTDYQRMTGAIEFYEASLESGIQPILGLELDVSLPAEEFSLSPTGNVGGVVLLAQDLSGWANLCRLSSLINNEPHLDSGTLPFDLLAENSQGMVCLSGGLHGIETRLISQGNQAGARSWLLRLRDVFLGRLYVELQQHAIEDRYWTERLARLAKQLEIPTVATHNVYYLEPEQDHLLRIATAIRYNRPLDQLGLDELPPPRAHLASPDEMTRKMADYPEAIARTEQIAEQCRLDLPLGVPHFPEIDLKGEMTPIQALRRRAEAGARKLYAVPQKGSEEIPSPVLGRLEIELAVIEEKNYAALFLVMEEIINFARQEGIPISSRGSAASSLVAHCLGITSPDPIRHDLYFERFLNPARATPPDIDTDLCSRRRDEVIEFVYRRYGVERVAMVCTVIRFRRRSALREVAKAYGLLPQEVNALAEGLPHRWYGPPERFSEGESPYIGLRERFTSPLYTGIFRDAAALIDVPRHLSIHPGGVVISPGPMTELVPTQLASKGVVITQFDLGSIERLGLVKIDLLGIRGLTVLGDVARAVGGLDKAQGAGIAGSSKGFILEVLDAIPDEDDLTADLVEEGRTIGCFQIESPGMRATLREVRARSMDDIMVALALYRPGPLTGGLKKAFVARHRGLEGVEYLHPALEHLLSETYGVILYQEQVLRIAHELAGLSLADADLLRRAMSHFDPGDQMRTLKERFISGASMRGGVPEKVGERVWELMAAFAGYGFPKAHAASYAQISWQAAWCKAHHPGLFMAAVLANWGGYYGQRVYLMEARRLGLRLQPPHVNYARSEFSLQYEDSEPVLFMGLNQVRELTRRTQERILKKRPFHSLRDFLARVDPRSVEAENLVRSGCLEGMGSIPELLHQVRSGSGVAGQMLLFEMEAIEDDWSLEDKAFAQEAVLGVSVIAHLLELRAKEIASIGALTTLETIERPGESVRVAGMRQTWRRSRTHRGEPIYFMALEDLEGMLDVVISGEVYRRYRGAFSDHGPFVVEGMVEFDSSREEPYLRATRVWRVDEI